MGTVGIPGLGPLLLCGRSIVLVHGENYFSEEVGGEEAALAPTKVGCPRTSIRAASLAIYTVYTHTRSPVLGKSVPLFRFELQGSVMGIKRPLATLKRLTPIFLLGFVVRFSEVELGDGPLAAAVGQLVGDALTVALQFGEVLVKDFARAQGRDEVVELAAFLPALLRLPRLALPLPLLLQLHAMVRGGKETSHSHASGCVGA